VTTPRNPDEIQREIEQTRESLSSTLDELVDRTSPKKVAERGKEQGRESLTALQEQLLTTQQGRTALGAAGGVLALLVGLRLRRARRKKRERLRRSR